MGLMPGEFDKVKSPDEYSGVCFCCGYPLSKHQIAADIEGKIIDYTDHDQSPCRVCLCHECYLKGQEYTNGGIEGAVRRSKLMINMTKSDIQKLESS